MSLKEGLLRRLEESCDPTGVIEGYETVEVVPVQRTFDRVDAAFISRSWNTLCQANRGLYSNPLCAAFVDDIRLEDGGKKLVIPVYTTDFKSYRATWNHPELRVWATGARAILRLRHNGELHHVFGERKKKTLSLGGPIENLPAGWTEPPHLESEHPYHANLLDELEEETGIPRGQVAVITPLRTSWFRRDPLDDDRVYQDLSVDFVVDVEGVSPDQLQRLFAQEDREHERLVTVPHSRLLEYLDGTFEDGNLAHATRLDLNTYIKREF